MTGRALLALLLLLAGAAGAAEPLFDARGYRVREFRADTGDRPPPGVALIDTIDLGKLVTAGAGALVDVLPVPPRPATLPAGALWLPPARNDIPGSLWLPDLGLPALSPERETRFRATLAAFLAGRAGPVVVYCLERCWLSWNAARRLAEWGVSDVRWYPEGTDGWAAAGLPTARAEPAVRPEEFP
ncbi:rhodanese-like domain-containing protein [Azospirillum sp. TSO22-1]|uniref:rhodanese-like domain-containing protein n=1 Tax=Azospirillum sp. TSO22-1 TaxID=716789 RepID=UPI000D621BAA|nr:rhodanese-like domain-containing protein [Azospirillum sp. TSO22-1]PWC53987.1 hypothetical protein TSO221_09735 [Azospirillum sp. TSO22-1]